MLLRDTFDDFSYRNFNYNPEELWLLVGGFRLIADRSRVLLIRRRLSYFFKGKKRKPRHEEMKKCFLLRNVIVFPVKLNSAGLYWLPFTLSVRPGSRVAIV